MHRITSNRTSIAMEFAEKHLSSPSKCEKENKPIFSYALLLTGMGT